MKMLRVKVWGNTPAPPWYIENHSVFDTLEQITKSKNILETTPVSAQLFLTAMSAVQRSKYPDTSSWKRKRLR